MLNTIAQIIFDKKGVNILALDVRDVSTLTDFFVIAEGSVDRHVRALSRSIEEELKKIGETPIHVEGLETGDWIVMDYGDVLIHLFTPELREKYGLEQLWHDGKIVDLDIAISENANNGIGS